MAIVVSVVWGFVGTVRVCLVFNDVDDDETRNGGGKCPDFRPHWGFLGGWAGK